VQDPERPALALHGRERDRFVSQGRCWLRHGGAELSVGRRKSGRVCIRPRC
jgi:hypothetical protein